LTDQPNNPVRRWEFALHDDPRPAISQRRRPVPELKNGDDLNRWRKRMGYTVNQAAEVLGLTYARLKENLYHPDRPPSSRTLRLAEQLESSSRRATHA